jgi:hypothetical protein
MAATIIKIKFSQVTNTPSTLAVGELAYSTLSNTLFIGDALNTPIAIGGAALFIKLAGIDAENIAYETGATFTGTLTLSGDPLNALEAATKQYVDNVVATIALTPGPIGPQGPSGPTGPAGPAGADGSPGAPGPAGPTGPTGPAGANGADGTGVAIKGTVPTVGDLPPTGNTEGDAYIVEADGHMHVWGGTSWTDVGKIVGPAGPTGPTGPSGPAGATGATGATGAQGPSGADGAPGPQGTPGATGPAGAKGDPGPGIATGGLAGQFLIKNSNTNYDTTWTSEIDGGSF